MTPSIDATRYQEQLDLALGVSADDRSFLARGLLGPRRAEAILRSERIEAATKLSIYGLGTLAVVGVSVWVVLQLPSVPVLLWMLGLLVLAIFAMGATLALVRFVDRTAKIRSGRLTFVEGLLEKTYVPGSKGAAPRHLVRVEPTTWFDVPEPVARGVAAARPHRIHFVAESTIVVAIDLLG